jgi:Zn-dependent protease with chaperone function
VLVAWCLRAGVGFSRLVLRVFVFLGNLVSCFLSRQMEYDADSCEIRLVGSQTFEATVRRMHALSRALQRAHEVLKIEWNHKRLLPDNLPAFLLQQDARLPLSLRAKLDDTIGLAKTGLLHTHPSDGDRIGRARQANEAGIFQLEGPATALFSNFDVVARQVTFLHYTDDLRLEAVPGALVPVAPA